MQDAWHDAFTHFDSTRKHKYACDNIQRRRNNDNKQWNCKLNEMNGNWLGSNDCEPTDNYDTHTTQIYPAAMRFRYPISIATKSIRWAHDSTNTMQLLWSATILPIRWHPQWQPSRWRCANQSRKMSPTKPFYCNCLLLDWMHYNFALFLQQRGSMCDCLQVTNDCWRPTAHDVGGNFEVNERTIHWNKKKKNHQIAMCARNGNIYLWIAHQHDSLWSADSSELYSNETFVWWHCTVSERDFFIQIFCNYSRVEENRRCWKEYAYFRSAVALSLTLSAIRNSRTLSAPFMTFSL